MPVVHVHVKHSRPPIPPIVFTTACRLLHMLSPSRGIFEQLREPIRPIWPLLNIRSCTSSPLVLCSVSRAGRLSSSHLPVLSPLLVLERIRCVFAGAATMAS